MLVPKLVTTLKHYDRAQFFRDSTAGIIVGIVALPLAIAFAIASGVEPGRGLWTAIIAGATISVLGGSRVQIGGPTGAFVVIVYDIVQTHGTDGLMVATLMAGVLLVIMGLARFGDVIRFIPHPLVTGFTSGIAVIIFSGEVRDFFGLRMTMVPSHFVEKWQAFAAAASTASLPAIAVGIAALAIIVLWPRVSTRIPGPFVALIATTAGAQLLHLNVETIGSRFGAIAAGIPTPAVPHVALAMIPSLAGPALTIALLAAIESLLSAMVADGMIGTRHRSNMELVAQGIANIASPLFGGIPATGAIARTATNVKNGGRTPVAGLIHAVTLLLITVFAGRWAGLIPMPALAAILVVVAYHMSEWRTVVAEMRSPKSDVAVLVTTFVLTVFVDLTVALEAGMVLAAFLFMRRMAAVATVSRVTGEIDDDDGRTLLDARVVPAGVEVYEITGPLFFGAVQQFRDTIGQVASKPRVLIIRLRHVPVIDSSGIRSLQTAMHQTRRDGTQVILSELQPQPLLALRASAAMRDIDAVNLVSSLELALARALALTGSPPR